MASPITPKERLKFISAGALLAGLVVFILAWAVSVPLYGMRYSPGLLILGPLLIALFVAIALADTGVRAIHFSASFFLFMVLSVIPSMYAPSVEDSFLASAAIAKVQESEKSLARPSPIRDVVSRASVSREQTQLHRDLLSSIVLADHQRKSVIQHLAMARALGADASFVSQTLMVREQDRQILLDRALELAGQGDLVAAQWLGMVSSDF